MVAPVDQQGAGVATAGVAEMEQAFIQSRTKVVTEEVANQVVDQKTCQLSVSPEAIKTLNTDIFGGGDYYLPALDDAPGADTGKDPAIDGPFLRVVRRICRAAKAS